MVASKTRRHLVEVDEDRPEEEWGDWKETLWHVWLGFEKHRPEPCRFAEPGGGRRLAAGAVNEATLRMISIQRGGGAISLPDELNLVNLDRCSQAHPQNRLTIGTCGSQ